MLIEEVHKRNDICRLEEKFKLNQVSKNIYKGKYPLEYVVKDSRGVYGGDFVSQGLLAAWETVPGPDFTPHSFHSYFIKAGKQDSVMKWEIEIVNDGKTYSNRIAKCYQSENNTLCFYIVISFTNKNSRKRNLSNSVQSSDTVVPYHFQDTVPKIFYKYKDILDTVKIYQHFNDLVVNFLPPEYFDGISGDLKNLQPGDRELGFFFKINDRIDLSKNEVKSRHLAMTYLSDSTYLMTLSIAMGLKNIPEMFNFFRVSMDHTVYFYDSDFDPTQWHFLSYRFPKMTNGRVLCYCEAYDLSANLIATFIQEAIAMIPKRIADKAVGGTYKL